MFAFIIALLIFAFLLAVLLSAILFLTPREKFADGEKTVNVNIHETTATTFTINLEDAGATDVKNATNIKISLSDSSQHSATISSCTPLSGGKGSDNGVKWDYVVVTFKPELTDAAKFKKYNKTSFVITAGQTNRVCGGAGGGDIARQGNQDNSVVDQYSGCGTIYDASTNTFKIQQMNPPNDVFNTSSSINVGRNGRVDLVDKAVCKANANEKYALIKTTACGKLGFGPPEMESSLSWENVVTGKTSLPLPDKVDPHFKYILKAGTSVTLHKNPDFPLAVIAHGNLNVNAANYDSLIQIVHAFFQTWAVPLRLIMTHNQTVPVILALKSFKPDEIAMPVGGGASPIGKELCTGVVLNGEVSADSASTVIHEFMHALFPRISCEFTSVFGTCPFPSKGPYDAVMYGEGMAVFISKYAMESSTTIADPNGFKDSLKWLDYFGAFLKKTHRSLDGMIQMSNYNAVIKSNADNKKYNNDAYMACLPYMLDEYHEDPANPNSKLIKSSVESVEKRWFSRYSFTHFYYHVASTYGIGAFVAMNYHMGESGGLLESLSVLLKAHPSDLMAQFIWDLLLLSARESGMKNTNVFNEIKALTPPISTTIDVDWKAFVIFDSRPQKGKQITVVCDPQPESWRCVDFDANSEAVVYKGKGALSITLSSTSRFFVLCTGGIAYANGKPQPQISL
jgi:hypothetical protein